MAFGTVPCAFHQIFATLIGLGHVAGQLGRHRSRLPRLAIQESQPPQAYTTPHVERELELMLRHRIILGRQRHHVGVQIAHILTGKPLIRGIGKGRVQVLAIQTARAHALAQRPVELGQSPFANAALGMRRDIGHMEGAELRLQHPSPTQYRVLVLTRRGMTGGAVRGHEHFTPVLQVRPFQRRQLTRPMQCRPCPRGRQYPISRRAQHHQAGCHFPDPSALPPHCSVPPEMDGSLKAGRKRYCNLI